MRLFLAVVLAALALPATAQAHANLRVAWPDARERLESAPREIRLTFDQGVGVAGAKVEVIDARGRGFALPVRAGSEVRELRAPVRRLHDGGYTVRWRAVGPDGHLIVGVYTFGVRATAPPPTEAYGARGPSRVEKTVRWLYFAALALLIGGLGFRLLVLPSDLPPRVARRIYALVGVGAVAALELGIVAFLLRADGIFQVPFEELLYADLSPLANGTRFGQAFVFTTIGLAFTLALAFFAWLSGRRALLWPAFALALGVSSGLSLSGHSAADGWAAQVADWVHLAAASMWAGGLVMLAFCVWPVAAGLRRDAFLRFSRLATTLIALVITGGVYLSIERLPRLAALWEEEYGRVLMLKLALVTVALAWGGIHHLFVRPSLQRGTVPSRLRKSLAGESAVGMAVLLAAAILVNSEPPPPDSGSAPVASAPR